MRRILLIVFSVVLLARPATADTVLLENFESDFPEWSLGWLGLNSNLTNYYATIGFGNVRGNNPDGLWVDDGDGTKIGDLVEIIFTPEFAAELNNFSIDITGWVEGTFNVFDKDGASLLPAALIPVTMGALTDPATGYGHFATSSNNGVGGFSFKPALPNGQIEGNTSIDNVSVTKKDNGAPATVPEPSSLVLLLTAGLGAVFVGANGRLTLR